MSFVQAAAKRIAAAAATSPRLVKAMRVYRRYRTYTMIGWPTFVSNLLLCAEHAPAAGCIVEAGVWRGGMSAGISHMLPGRVHYLFDSFEGLPPAADIDGEAALQWQRDTTSPGFYDNCRADQSFAERAMGISAAREFHIVKGWFNETIPGFVPAEPIAVLRVDGDWYESTMQCLTGLYPHVMQGGLIILDDYYAWDGCSRAVHDYLSAHRCADRIEKGQGGVCYLQKRAASNTLA